MDGIAVRRSVLLAILRLIAAGYIRSIDPIGMLAQRFFTTLGLRRAEHAVWEFRTVWRQWFEDRTCAMAHDRILRGIDVVLGFYADTGYLLLPSPKEELYFRLMGALYEDPAFLAEMADLQKLPIGRLALQRRLEALDAGVERHMADLAHEMVMDPAMFEGVASGGVQLRPTPRSLTRLRRRLTMIRRRSSSSRRSCLRRARKVWLDRRPIARRRMKLGGRLR
jgi:hypothetical protein